VLVDLTRCLFLAVCKDKDGRYSDGGADNVFVLRMNMRDLDLDLTLDFFVCAKNQLSY